MSHANPEDNQFTVWLALQLASEGYQVWSDLTRLLGGEVFWEEIEDLIRYRAVKFLYVLSRTSNGKRGPLNELQVALGVERREDLKDFIIPLHIDDLPAAEVTIELARVNYVSFEESWAAGLAQVLNKLEKDQVPKDPRYNRCAVNEWWRTQFSAASGIRDEPEVLLSNWFPIVAHPEGLFCHSLGRRSIGKIQVPDMLPYPSVKHNDWQFFSFAKAEDFEGTLGPDTVIAQSEFVLWNDISDTKHKCWNYRMHLLSLACEETLRQRLPRHELANKRSCFYFTKQHLQPGERLSFKTSENRRIARSLLGTRSIMKSGSTEPWTRYWHFGIRAYARLSPVPLYVLRSHVLFSNDARTIWESKKRLHRARRSQCRSWWNPVWRDRMLVALHWLSQGNPTLSLPVGSDRSVVVSVSPLPFLSPVSYTDPQDLQEDDELDESEDAPEPDDEDDPDEEEMG